MHRAYTICGFAVFTNVYNEWLSEFQDWKQLMEEFFQVGNNRLTKMTTEEDEKYEKETRECGDKMIEISQECKDYWRRRFETDFDDIHENKPVDI